MWYIILIIIIISLIEKNQELEKDLKLYKGKVETTEYLRRYVVDGKDNE